MSLFNKIKNDWLEARKNREPVVSNLLGTLIGTIENKAKTFNPARDLSDAEVVAEVKRILAGVTETIGLLQPEDPRAAVAHAEKACLENYIPRQMERDQIQAFAEAKKAEGMNMGQIMAALKSERPGEYDGRMASEVVKQVLAG